MSDVMTIAAEPRERAGKGAARATRRAGRVPGVIYGDKKDPVMVSLDPAELMRHARTHGFFSTLCEVKVGTETHRVLARDLQLHPVTDKPLHVDFMRISAGSKVTVDVEVVFENELKSPGIKRGGVLNVVRHEVELLCSPEAIPEKLVVDLTGLEIGDSIHFSSISVPAGVTPTITDRDFTVATIAAPSSVRSAASEEGEGEGEAESAEKK